MGSTWCLQREKERTITARSSSTPLSSRRPWAAAQVILQAFVSSQQQLAHCRAQHQVDGLGYLDSGFGYTIPELQVLTVAGCSAATSILLANCVEEAAECPQRAPARGSAVVSQTNNEPECAKGSIRKLSTHRSIF